jgi:hypothetical protein
MFIVQFLIGSQTKVESSHIKLQKIYGLGVLQFEKLSAGWHWTRSWQQKIDYPSKPKRTSVSEFYELEFVTNFCWGLDKIGSWRSLNIYVYED